VDTHLEYCLPLFIPLYYKRCNRTGRDSKKDNSDDESYGKASEQKIFECQRRDTSEGIWCFLLNHEKNK